MSELLLLCYLSSTVGPVTSDILPPKGGVVGWYHLHQPHPQLCYVLICCLSYVPIFKLCSVSMFRLCHVSIFSLCSVSIFRMCYVSIFSQRSVVLLVCVLCGA